jgi:hypothetical protein
MNFRFQCLLDLHKNLGQHDAIAEATEVAVRSFLLGAQGVGDFNHFLTAQSQAVGIKVDYVNLQQFQQRIALGYLISVHQSLEIFLKDFRIAHIDFYGEEWHVGEAKSSLLDKVIKKIGKADDGIAAIGAHTHALLDYYRLVRNAFAHTEVVGEQELDASKGKIRNDKGFENLEQFLPAIQSDYPRLKAPNPLSNIGFDDFLLFTRAVKKAADGLMAFCKPTEKQLYDYYDRLQLFRKYPAGSSRKRNAMIGDMSQRFGIERTDTEKLLNSTFASLA